MKNLTKITVGTLLAGALYSCSMSYPVAVTNNPVGPKRGVAYKKVILGIRFGHTDLGIIKAAKQGGIDKVGSVDFKISGGLFVKKYTTIVMGDGPGVEKED